MAGLYSLTVGHPSYNIGSEGTQRSRSFPTVLCYNACQSSWGQGLGLWGPQGSPGLSHSMPTKLTRWRGGGEEKELLIAVGRIHFPLPPQAAQAGSC